MTSELIAVNGCTVGHSTGSVISGGTFTITSVPSTVMLSGDNGVYSDKLTVTFSGGSASGFVPNSVATTAPVNIPATTIITTTESKAVLRVGDGVLMTCTGTLPPPTGGTASVSGNIEITDAGQNVLYSK